MCNLYSLTKGQAAIRDWFRARHDRTGNLPLFPGIFPDQLAPIVRAGTDDERELVMARWGMPGPPQYGGAPVTNIRNLESPHWRGWLGRQNRCLVPATSFCEYADTKPRKTPIWFALAEDRPLFAFAGLWTRWRGVRGSKSAPVVDGAASSRLPALPHSITSSAAASTVGGISMPSALAVWRLTRGRICSGIEPGGLRDWSPSGCDQNRPPCGGEDRCCRP